MTDPQPSQTAKPERRRRVGEALGKFKRHHVKPYLGRTWIWMGLPQTAYLAGIIGVPSGAYVAAKNTHLWWTLILEGLIITLLPPAVFNGPLNRLAEDDGYQDETYQDVPWYWDHSDTPGFQTARVQRWARVRAPGRLSVGQLDQTDRAELGADLDRGELRRHRGCWPSARACAQRRPAGSRAAAA